MGKGFKLLFCFHGYGEKAEMFAVLETHLGEDYTIVALDMPFHGQTIWNEGLLFTDEELLEIMGRYPCPLKGGKRQTTLHFKPLKIIITSRMSSLPPFRGWGQGRGHGSGHAFSLLGYSMGGRIALQLLQKAPSSVERVVLVAPDGLHKNRWYRFATQNFIGNRLFNIPCTAAGVVFNT